MPSLARFLSIAWILAVGLVCSPLAAQPVDALDLPAPFYSLTGQVVLQEWLASLDEALRHDRQVAMLEHPDPIDEQRHALALERRREVVNRLAPTLRALAGVLRGDGAVADDLRAFLARDDAADILYDTWLADAEFEEPARYIGNSTRLGRALHRDADGAWWLNPHTAWDVFDLLEALDEYGARRAALLEVNEDPELVRRAMADTPDLEVDANAALRDRLRDPALGGEERSRLEARFGAVRRELDAPGARTVIDLAALAYDTEGLDLLRSSIFYNPRTRHGLAAYHEIGTYHAARLFGLWGWNAKVSRDEADLVGRLRSRGRQLKAFAQAYDKIVIHISGVPPWLSSHDEDGVFEGGGWEDRQAHPPRDIETWKRLVRELALMFREVKDTERYYEFWNEPDIEFWQGTQEEFLDLYAVTARVIREADPEGRIGGAAPNQWDGRIGDGADAEPINIALMRRAARDDLPLDFISWHHFGRPIEAIAEARATYAQAWRDAGLPSEPEFLVTEWSSPYRGTAYANAPFAELMIAFRDARVDAQMVSCLEEFHAKPDPKGFAPWGLVTQQGHRSNRWYVHRFFDTLGRGSRGVAIVRPSDERTVVVSRRGGGFYDVLIWQTGTASRMQAARDVLVERGFTRAEAGRFFRVRDRLERAIAAGEAPAPEWAEAFAAGQAAYRAHPVSTPRLVLELPGVRSIRLLDAEAVRTRHDPAPRVAVFGNTLSCPLAPQEVVRLRFRAR